jgi:anaerobic selenocysteine-containing dehydrogenase
VATQAPAEVRTHYRTCPFCEATCGLEVQTSGREVLSVRGDERDVLSGGFICPKAHGLKQLHEDPDRLTAPLVRRNGSLVEALGLEDGGRALVRSAAGGIEAPVEVTDAIMPGVVSIPHGWGHDVDGNRMRVAARHPGVNSNVLADETRVESLSGNAVLNGIPVEVEPA